MQSKSHAIVIDVGPDFRYQALKAKINQVDAVFITHEHNDHIIGLDDLRPLIFKNREPMKIYAEQRVLEDVKLRFNYAFGENYYPGAPSFDLHVIRPGENISIGDIKIEAIRVFHGNLPSLGYIVQNQLAYLTDMNELPSESRQKIKNIDVLVLDALRKKKHHSHNNLEEAVQMSTSVHAKRTFLIHMSHLMGRTSDWENELPSTIFPSYDGMTFELKGE